MTQSSRPLCFDEMCDWLVSINSPISPSEVHGFLVGLLSAGKRLSDPAWIQEASDLLDAGKGLNQQDEEILHCIYANTLSALSDDDLNFYPLLPDDSDTIEQRLESLSYWCQGFLAGFALVEKSLSNVADLVNDALHDLAAITQVNINDDASFDNSADQDYMQLVEYVRLAALNISAEYQPSIQTDNTPSSMFSSQQLFRNRQLH